MFHLSPQHPSSFQHHPAPPPSRHYQQQPAPAHQNNNVQLPRTLSRPQFSPISRDAILAVAPELADVPPEYIRRSLRANLPQMQAGLASLAPSHLPTSLPRSHLPPSLSIPLRPQSANPTYPTHILALSSSSSSKQPAADALALHPVHALILASNCAKLPRLPPAAHAPAAPSLTLPILPLTLPSPAAFPLLSAYMYAHRADALLHALLPLPPSFIATLAKTPAALKDTLASGPRLHQLSAHLLATAHSSLQTLTAHAAHITALWRNAVALGMYEPELWDAMDLAWEVVLGALSLAATGH